MSSLQINPRNLTIHPTINTLISYKNWIKYLTTTHKTILRLRYHLIQNLSQDLVYAPHQIDRSEISNIGGTVLLRD